MSHIESIHTAILEGDAATAQTEVRAALAAEEPAGKILSEGLIAAMTEVGRRFEEGEYFVPEMLIAARAMQASLGILKPYLVQGGVVSAGKVVIGTVKGDLHDIGKNLVSMMLEGAGFEVQDLGTDVAPEKFVAAAQTGDVQIVAMSALLTTTMPNMKSTIEALDLAGVRPKVKIMVGGAPVTEAYARQIGADGYSQDASRAVTTARSLL